MRQQCARMVAVCLLLAASGKAGAGGMHIRYGPDAPEKMAASNIRYYEGVLSLEAHHPLEFADEHPFYTKMFDDPVMLDKLLARWEAHEERFEFWHDCLWKVLDGYRASHHGLTPVLSSSVSQNPLDVGGLNITDRNGGTPGSVGPQGSQGGGGGGDVHTTAVPEPSSGVLLLLGLALGGSWLVRRLR